jgi:hypothetical protein
MLDKKSGCLTSFWSLLSRLISGKNPYAEPAVLPFKIRDDFLSPAEVSFYRVLKTMSGDSLIVCPKVSLNDIFYVSHPEKNYAYRNRIDRKHVDFLLLKAATLEPILAVELDDSSHKQPERVKRDELVDRVFSAAGLPLVRIPVRRSYDTRELAETFKKVMSSSTTS